MFILILHPSNSVLVNSTDDDAFGKEKSGAYSGATHLIGDYDGCLLIKASGWNQTIFNEEFIHDFDSKYCRSWFFAVGFSTLGETLLTTCLQLSWIHLWTISHSMKLPGPSGAACLSLAIRMMSCKFYGQVSNAWILEPHREQSQGIRQVPNLKYRKAVNSSVEDSTIMHALIIITWKLIWRTPVWYFVSEEFVYLMPWIFILKGVISDYKLPVLYTYCREKESFSERPEAIGATWVLKLLLYVDLLTRS